MTVWFIGILLLPASYARSHAPPLPCNSFCTATGSQGSLDDLDIPCSPSSFASLPRPTPLLDFLSQDAMLGEIVDLTRQNAEIRAQLDQNRPTPAGASVSREQSATRLSSSSSVARQASPCADQQHSQQVRCSLFGTGEVKLLFFQRGFACLCSDIFNDRDWTEAAGVESTNSRS